MRSGHFGLAALALVGARCAAQATVTTESLLREMIDLRALAEFPEPAFKTVQFSSYDRRSGVPGGPGWFSNADGFGNEPLPAFEAVVREPGEDGIGEYLVCDIEGPGAVVRCWTAAINGRIRMELDGAAVFEGTADDFLRRPFDVLGAEAGLDPAVFEGTLNQQNAAYCPMPFAERCRIVWTGTLAEVHFYEVQVRLYEAGTAVETFSAEALAGAAEAVREVGGVLGAPGEHLLLAASGLRESAIGATLGPGEAKDLLVSEDGPSAVVQMTLRAEAEDLERALRQTVLHVHFDGAPHGQVESPLGDFFGAAPGVNPFDSVPFTVEADGTMTCRFVMPFARSARVRAVNMGEQAVSVAGSVTLAPYDWNDETSMHFRARWRVDHGLIGDPAAPQDIPFLVAQGAGRYVGTASIMLNPTDVPTPGGGWWGEGDEKIFVDGDVAPSTYGTGSEDYYNYAWSIPDIFGFAYCGQPRNDGPGNRGFVTNHRWHIVDSLPFRERLAFYMELWPHRRVPGYSYARLGYHYARPGAIDDHLPITPEDVRPLELPAWTARAEGGARGSIFVEAEGALEPPPSGVSIREGALYSGGALALWSPAGPDDVLSLRFSVPESGDYAVGFCALQSNDSGPVRFWVDDRAAEDGVTSVDLRQPSRLVLRQIHSEPLALAPGEHTLHVSATGESGRIVGIDFLWIQRR